jgi:hypothetical protein
VKLWLKSATLRAARAAYGKRGAAMAPAKGPGAIVDVVALQGNTGLRSWDGQQGDDRRGQVQMGGCFDWPSCPSSLWQAGERF